MSACCVTKTLELQNLSRYCPKWTQHNTSQVVFVWKEVSVWSTLMVCGVLIALLCSVAPTRDMKSIQRPVWCCTLFSCYDEEVWNKSRTDIFLFMSPTLILTANIQSQGAGQAVCTCMWCMVTEWWFSEFEFGCSCHESLHRIKWGFRFSSFRFKFPILHRIKFQIHLRFQYTWWSLWILWKTLLNIFTLTISLLNLGILFTLSILLCLLFLALAGQFRALRIEFESSFYFIESMLMTVIPLISSVILTWFVAVEFPSLDISFTFTVCYFLYALMLVAPRISSHPSAAIANKGASITYWGGGPYVLSPHGICCLPCSNHPMSCSPSHNASHRFDVLFSTNSFILAYPVSFRSLP